MKIHIIKQGDTLYHLAKKYHVTVDELLKLNPAIKDPNQLQIGSKIRIPSPASGSGHHGGGTTVGIEIIHQHIVKSGDTMWKLSQQWGVTLPDLIAANKHIKNPNVLMQGDIVNIPKGISVHLPTGGSQPHMHHLSTGSQTGTVHSSGVHLLPGLKIHNVVAGDTLYKLSKQYGVALDDIITFNPNIANPDVLEIGMKVLIPNVTTGTGGHHTLPIVEIDTKHQYKVQSGDTMWNLAEHWNIPLTELVEANKHIANPELLHVGDVLNIPSSYILDIPIPFHIGKETTMVQSTHSKKNTAVQPMTHKKNTAVQPITQKKNTAVQPITQKKNTAVQMNTPKSTPIVQSNAPEEVIIPTPTVTQKAANQPNTANMANNQLNMQMKPQGNVMMPAASNANMMQQSIKAETLPNTKVMPQTTKIQPLSNTKLMPQTTKVQPLSNTKLMPQSTKVESANTKLMPQTTKVQPLSNTKLTPQSTKVESANTKLMPQTTKVQPLSNTKLVPQAIKVESANTKLMPQSNVMMQPMSNANMALQSNVMMQPMSNANMMPQSNVMMQSMSNANMMPQSNVMMQSTSNANMMPQSMKVESANTKLMPQSMKVESANTKLMPQSMKVESANTKLMPQSMKVESANTKLMPQSMKVESANTKLMPQSMKVESANTKLMPQSMKVESANTKLMPQATKIESMANTKIAPSTAKVYSGYKPLPNEVSQQAYVPNTDMLHQYENIKGHMPLAVNSKVKPVMNQQYQQSVANYPIYPTAPMFYQCGCPVYPNTGNWGYVQPMNYANNPNQIMGTISAQSAMYPPITNPMNHLSNWNGDCGCGGTPAANSGAVMGKMGKTGNNSKMKKNAKKVTIQAAEKPTKSTSAKSGINKPWLNV